MKEKKNRDYRWELEGHKECEGVSKILEASLVDKGGAKKRKAKDIRATLEVDKAAKSRSHAEGEIRRLLSTSALSQSLASRTPAWYNRKCSNSEHTITPFSRRLDPVILWQETS